MRAPQALFEESDKTFERRVDTPPKDIAERGRFF